MNDTADGDELVCGDRISCWIGSLPVKRGRRIGRADDGTPIQMRFPLYAVDYHAIVEQIHDHGEVYNGLEIVCRPTMREDGETYQSGDDYEESADDELIIVLVNTNAGREPDIHEVAMTRAQYDGIDQDLCVWESDQRADDDEDSS